MARGNVIKIQHCNKIFSTCDPVWIPINCFRQTFFSNSRCDVLFSNKKLKKKFHMRLIWLYFYQVHFFQKKMTTSDSTSHAASLWWQVSTCWNLHKGIYIKKKKADKVCFYLFDSKHFTLLDGLLFCRQVFFSFPIWYKMGMVFWPLLLTVAPSSCCTLCQSTRRNLSVESSTPHNTSDIHTNS